MSREKPLITEAGVYAYLRVVAHTMLEAQSRYDELAPERDTSLAQILEVHTSSLLGVRDHPDPSVERLTDLDRMSLRELATATIERFQKMR